MSGTEKPSPIDLDPSVLTDEDLADDDDDEDDVVAAPSAAPVAASSGNEVALSANPFEAVEALKSIFDGLQPIDVSVIPEKFRQHVNPQAPPPVRLMGARAMVPMPPKDMVHVVYQSLFDPDPRIAALAQKSFSALDDKILDVALKEALKPPVLNLLVRTLIEDPRRIEQIMLNRGTPDDAFVFVGARSTDQGIIEIIANNQERLLRCHDITRAIAANKHALRSDLDRAIDFLVREGVFIEDVDAFQDAFVRLGKHEMLEALKKIEISDALLTTKQKKMAQELGVDAEALLLGTVDIVARLDEEAEEDGAPTSGRRGPLGSYPIPVQIKLAMVGDHGAAMEAVHSANRVVATAGIKNPKIKEADIMKIVRSRTLADDVIRYICNNGDWTKSYSVKFALVQHPKTPIMLVTRWLPLLRTSDIRNLAKSKNIPSAVQAHAKKLANTRKSS